MYAPSAVDRAVHFRGIVLGPSGFACEGREWLAAFEAAGIHLSLEAASFGHLDEELDVTDRERIARCSDRPHAGSTVFHHLPIPHLEPVPGAFNIASVLFETETLPREWIDAVARVDRIVVRSEWQRGVLAAAGIGSERIAVVTPPLRLDDYAPPDRQAPVGRPFRWLSVFDWSLRKGYDLLLETFTREFARDEAELLIKIPPHRTLPESAIRACCERAQVGMGSPPRIEVRCELSTPGQLRGLYADADGFVLASRGEGWGRPVHEAMLMELPVVVTGATALTKLVPDDSVGYPVKASPAPVSPEAAAETEAFRGLTWYEPDPGELRRRMREVVADPATARIRARRGRNHIRALVDPGTVERVLSRES